MVDRKNWWQPTLSTDRETTFDPRSEKPSLSWWKDARSMAVGSRVKIFNLSSAPFSLERLAGPVNYSRYLEAQFQAPDPFPHSKGPENRIKPNSKEEEAYHQGPLQSYIWSGSKEKADFTDVNVGHKLHLNVPIEHVQAVSAYLKAHNYCHKYLSGGEPSKGKVFTIYAGSHKMAFTLASDLSQALGEFLARPVAENEVEYAPNIVGRFNAGAGKIAFPNGGRYDSYPNYGVRGMVTYRNLVPGNFFASPENQKPSLEKVQRNFRVLSQDFGDYFHG